MKKLRRKHFVAFYSLYRFLETYAAIEDFQDPTAWVRRSFSFSSRFAQNRILYMLVQSDNDTYLSQRDELFLAIYGQSQQQILALMDATHLHMSITIQPTKVLDTEKVTENS
jgi:hypothetical protein